MKINKILPCSLCILVSAAVFAADNTGSVMMDASPCLNIVSAIERLACFEEQANAAQGRGNGKAMPQQNLPVVSIPRSSRQQRAQTSQQDAPQPASERPQEVAREVAQDAESASMPAADSFEENFGLSEEKLNEGKAKEPANELIARVDSVRQLGPNLLVITLENGQVWQQMNSKRFALAEGDEVRIYTTRWGNSYRLSSQTHNGYIQVQRQQ